MNEPIVAEDAVSTKALKEQPLYANRVRVYPKAVSGLMRRIKWGAVIVLLAIYYIVPWLRWDRGPGVPDQAVLIDIANRRAYFFWIEIWPQEVYYLTGILILAALVLFLMTSLMGRVWCGYACPQTVWTDLFMWVERLIEGDRVARQKLDKAPLSAAKAAKKVTKHGAWLIISALTGGAWIMYFIDAPTVTADLVTGSASTQVYFFFGLLTGTTYLLAGWAREQVCTYMCPWPRIQSALVDEDSMIVTYRAWRGEPRGHYRRGDSWEGRGHCVDCRACIAVCPTGIDIRDGMQLECIGCGLCIDACDNVMDRLGLPRGLIAFDTERNLVLRAEGKPPENRLIRPRTVLYAVLTVLVAAIMLWTLSSRATVELDVLHDRNPLYVTLSDGSIRNGFTLKILNKAQDMRLFSLAVDGLPAHEMTVVGQEYAGEDEIVITAEPDTVKAVRVFVSVPRRQLRAPATNFSFVVEDVEKGERASRETVFRGPK